MAKEPFLKVFENDHFNLTHQGAIFWWNFGLFIAPFVMVLNAIDGKSIDLKYAMWTVATGSPFFLVLFGTFAIRCKPALSKILIWAGLVPAFLMQLFWITIGIFTIITVFSGALGLVCCHYIKTKMAKELNGGPVT